MESVLLDLPDESISCCVTDPPYGLKFMGKKWDYAVPSVEQWKEVYRVLKPGAFLLSFFGTRTYHRGVIAIEDAGFEIVSLHEFKPSKKNYLNYIFRKRKESHYGN